MMKKTRVLSWLIAAAVLFVILGSVVFLAVETGHDCSGHGCPVCAQLEACEEALQTLALAAGAALPAAGAAAWLLGPPRLSVRPPLRPATLITHKVKLSN